MIDIKKGNIFTSRCQTLVNTVNCVGVMGAGIAYECRLRYPEMYKRYVELCNEKLVKIGTLWIYKTDSRWILNFPTKTDWKFRSKEEYLIKGLQKFLDTYREKGITSIAFPLLGASNGGIPEEVSLKIMEQFLKECDIPVEIYHYDPKAYDELFEKFKNIWLTFPEKKLVNESGIGLSFVKKIKDALEDDSIKSISQLLSVRGIGDITLEKCFRFSMDSKEDYTLGF